MAWPAKSSKSPLATSLIKHAVGSITRDGGGLNEFIDHIA